MDPDDGSWRFIYVNATGQIIGSVRYATLQQMAIMDLNNGQMPSTASALPGAVSAASLSSIPSADTSDTGNSGTSSDNSSAANSASTSAGGNASVGGTNGQSLQGNSPQTPSGSTDNSAGPDGQGQQNSNSNETPAFGQGQPASTFGSPPAAGQNATSLAQLAELKPTGPVDGPVIGGFLSGVGIPTAIDRNSIKIYHGGKKYKDWEFIWNPLEDQAQALQQGLGAAQGQGLLPGQAAGANPFGRLRWARVRLARVQRERRARKRPRRSPISSLAMTPLDRPILVSYGAIRGLQWPALARNLRPSQC